ncbi:MAG: cytochrome c family protein [Pseudomonadota bacterium]
MDTMQWTKVTGALCGALLFFLLVHWAAEERYHIGGKDHAEHHGDDHGDDHHEEKTALAWIELPDADAPAVVEEVVEVPFEDVFAMADAAEGQKVFRKCVSCHKVEDGANGTGPHLYSVVGRAVGIADGYAYSSALAELGGEWTPENLNGFLTRPGDWAPGTKMNFKLDDVEDRANVIAYLQSIGG